MFLIPWCEKNIDTVPPLFVPIDTCMENGAASIGLVHEINGNGKHHEFSEGSIYHAKQPDIKQEVYGMPD